MASMTSTSKASCILLMINNHCTELECAVCYKDVNNKSYIKCNAPCNKIFHRSCMERIMEQTEDNAYEEDEDAEHKCPYCRRGIDMDNYALQTFARHLLAKRVGGFDVSEAIQMINEQFQSGDIDPEMDYAIYERLDISHQKTPKQPKRTAFKKIAAQQPRRITIKTNIGGRRR